MRSLAKLRRRCAIVRRGGSIDVSDRQKWVVKSRGMAYTVQSTFQGH